MTAQVDSHNVVARLEGADPEKSDEHIVFTAHWDHLGRDPALEGDQIFNGRADNASGVAALLEIAAGRRRARAAARSARSCSWR